MGKERRSGVWNVEYGDKETVLRMKSLLVFRIYRKAREQNAKLNLLGKYSSTCNDITFSKRHLDNN